MQKSGIMQKQNQPFEVDKVMYDMIIFFDWFIIVFLIVINFFRVMRGCNLIFC
jgi:hypothetical protein